MKYEVNVSRTSFSTGKVIVDAETLKEAEAKALEEAKNIKFLEKHTVYTMTEVTKKEG